tara:strand:- start:180 stop:392 length:213 start_codon:yes stop_codon:yes gene_type:complete
MMTTETYGYGYKTLERAYAEIEDDLSNDLLSLCERPRPRLYKNKMGQRRYKIVVDVDHGHCDITTDLAHC